jgi:hypothetical protein
MVFKEKKDELVDAGIKPSDLDSMIIDVKLKEASDLNNMGMDQQLTFLFQRGFKVSDIIYQVYG